jgi:hypothetical protein
MTTSAIPVEATLQADGLTLRLDAKGENGVGENGVSRHAALRGGTLKP